jgi:predicted nucleic acid-binding protein
MKVVLDVSAAVSIALKRPETASLKATLMSVPNVSSPTLFFSEASNVFAKYVRGHFLSRQVATDLLQLTIGLVDEFHNPVLYATEAMTEAICLNLSAYDMYYLLLARRTGAALASMDKKLLQLAEKEGVPVV